MVPVSLAHNDFRVTMRSVIRCSTVDSTIVLESDWGTTTLAFKHGTRYGYMVKHCPCDECREWGSRDNREAREKAKRQAANNVRQLRPRRNGVPAQPKASRTDTDKPEKPRPPGETELAVLDECSKLSVAQDRPAMVATAVRMARILDNESLVAIHPTTSRQLTSILNDLRGGSRSKRKGGRLASVQQMTGRKAVGNKGD